MAPPALFSREFESSGSMVTIERIQELSPPVRKLIALARDRQKLAYAPYSRFLVGAALETTAGEYVFGANQENASFPLSMCAERIALYSKAMLYPEQDIRRIAICVRHLDKVIDEPGSPCGACRQVLLEFARRQGNTFGIILQGASGPVYVFDSIMELIPFPFNGRFL